jgi:RNA polymerase sigma factor (sigma-70 family)
VSASISWDKLPDIELAARVRTGNTAAFDGIVKRYSPMMLGFFLNELGSGQFQQAEDLTSETMTAAWTTLCSGRSALPENFKAWLFGTARHILSRHLREKITRGEVLAFEPEAYDFEDRKVLDDFREVEYEQGLPQFLKLVDNAIESMPAKYRDVIRINMRDGRTGRALAAQVGVTPAEASRLLNEARPKLVDAVGTLLMARTCREACPKFDSYLQAAGWAGGPFSDELRRRLMQHISGCPTCKSARSRDKWIVFLPSLVPVLVAPELHQRIVNVAFATKDVGLPSTSFDSGHRFNGGSSTAENFSTPSRYTYSSMATSGPFTNISDGSGKVTDSPASILNDDRSKRGNGGSKLRTEIVFSVALLLLLTLGISAYHINDVTSKIINRQVPAPLDPTGPPAVKDATPPDAGSSHPSPGAADRDSGRKQSNTDPGKQSNTDPGKQSNTDPGKQSNTDTRPRCDLPPYC